MKISIFLTTIISYNIITKIVLFILLQLATLSLIAQVSGGGAKKDYNPIWLSECQKKLEDYRKEKQVDPLQNVFPFWGKKLREEGYQLPLPLGVGINAIIMRQTNKLSEFNLLIDNTKIPYDLQVYDIQSTDLNITFRPDLWVFPFLNVYGILGYTSGSVKPAIMIPNIVYDDPILGEIEINEAFVINETIEYQGRTVGFGTTIAGGYKSMFFTLDYNYTVSKMDIIKDEIIAYTITPRIGVTMNAYNTKGKGVIYVGAMYLHVHQTITDNINLRETAPDIADIIGDEIGYSMTLGVKEPINFIIGGAWQINQHMNLMVETGMGDRSQLMIGFDYRF